jgi:3-hydroxyisobutyrate dehydrogenase-like beta-hydroxyacid dehydrogenase
MRKDLDIVIQEAQRTDAPVEITKLVDAFYAELQTNGGGRLDTSSLISRLRPVPE